MTNLEFYKDRIEELIEKDDYDEWMEFFDSVGMKRHCFCMSDDLEELIWLLSEYKEPEIDWSKVAVDTPVLVRDNEYDKWLKRHFARYENGKAYVYDMGRTSWTSVDEKVICWNYAKLEEEEE